MISSFTHLLENLNETAINLISCDSHFEGTLTLEAISRINGVLKGKIRAKPGSTLILSETAVVEGEIQADTLFIDGYVEGKIHATSKVIISCTGRVVGEINTPSLVIEPEAYLEGRCKMVKVTAAENS